MMAQRSGLFFCLHLYRSRYYLPISRIWWQ